MRVSSPEWIAPAMIVVGVAALGSIVILALGAARRRAGHPRSAQDTQEARIERLEEMLARLDDRLARLERPPAATAPATSTIDLKPIRSDPTPDPLRRSVYALADRGHEPIEIAGQLDEQVGKVELILALRGFV